MTKAFCDNYGKELPIGATQHWKGMSKIDDDTHYVVRVKFVRITNNVAYDHPDLCRPCQRRFMIDAINANDHSEDD